MTNKIYLRAWGDYACFTSFARNERISYPLMTQSAARALLETILYKPEFRWQVERIAVHSPIKFTNIKTNELKFKISKGMEYINASNDRTQNCSLILKNPCYVIETSVLEKSKDPENSYKKYIEMFNRRVSNGQHFRAPYFGQRQFIANTELSDEHGMTVDPNPNPDNNFGYILFDRFDLDKKEQVQKSTVFEAILFNGVYTIPTWEFIKNNYSEFLK